MRQITSSNLGSRLMGGSILVFLAEALMLPTGLVTAVFLTRSLGPEGYGEFTLVATLVFWLEWSVASLFSRATVKLVGEVEDWRPVGSAVVSLHLVAGAGVALLLLLTATSLSNLLGEPHIAGYLRLFALDVPLFSLAQAHRNLLVGVGALPARAYVAAGRWLSRMVFVLLLVGLGLSVPGAIGASIGASAVELGLGRCFIRPGLFRRSAFPLRRLWDYALPLFLFALSLQILQKVDLFALKLLGGSLQQVGVYGAAQNLSVLPGIVALSFAPPLLSTLSRVLAGGDLSSAREMGRQAERAVLLMMPFAAIAVGASVEIVEILYGPDFLAAAPLLALLTAGALPLLMITVTTTVMAGGGKPNLPALMTLPLVPVAVVGHLLMIPRFGATGAALVTDAAACMGALATMAAVYRVWKILPPSASLLRSLFLSVLAYTLAALPAHSGPLVAAKLALVALVVVIAYILLGEFTLTERNAVRSLLRLKEARRS